MLTTSCEKQEPAELDPTGEQIAPWMEADAFMASPEPLTFGYMRDKRTYSCTEETLLMRLREDKNKGIILVWTPGASRLTVPEEHPWLLEAVRERQAAHHRSAGLRAFIALLMIGALAAIGLSSSSRASLFYLILLVAAVVPLIVSCWQLYRLRSFTQETLAAEIPDSRFSAWMAARRTHGTTALLIGVLSVAFLQYLVLPWTADEPLKAPIEAAGIVKDAVRYGEWWRLFTGAFLHGPPFHLFMNVAALIALSRAVEVTAHRALVPLVFIVSVFTGSIFSLVLLPNGTSVGTSGGIMGMLGLVLVAAWLQKRHFPASFRRSLMLAVVLIAGVGIAAYEYIDNAAHAGGLLAGAAIGATVMRRQPVPGKVVISPRLVAASVLAWCAIAATTLLTIFKLIGTME